MKKILLSLAIATLVLGASLSAFNVEITTMAAPFYIDDLELDGAKITKKAKAGGQIFKAQSPVIGQDIPDKRGEYSIIGIEKTGTITMSNMERSAIFYFRTTVKKNTYNRARVTVEKVKGDVTLKILDNTLKNIEAKNATVTIKML